MPAKSRRRRGARGSGEAPFRAAPLGGAEEARLIAHVQAGRIAEARTEAEALARRHPGASLPRRILGVLAAREGATAQATAQAIAHFEAALAGDAPDRETFLNLARLQLRSGRAEDALDTLHQLSAASPDGRDLPRSLLLAQALEGAGHGARGLEAALDALALAPGDEKALAVFARLAPHAASASARLDRALARLVSHPARLRHDDFKIANARLAQAIAAGGALSQETRALLRAVLADRMVADRTVERHAAALRARLLAEVAAGAALSAEDAALLEALALHGFTTEHLWDETAEEAGRLALVSDRVGAALAGGARPALVDLFALGAYRPLHRIEAVRGWATSAAGGGAVPATLRTVLLDPLAEEAIARDLPALTPIDDAVSEAVRAQYEANPYPRWRAPQAARRGPYLSLIAEAIAPHRADLGEGAARPQVLVAGCGTGQHPISVALRYEGAAVMAVDLSRASLAYGARQAKALGVGNVRFAQADILRLPEIDARFDVVEASGVIHHMRDPEEGLSALLSVLKPGGLLKLGLYSAHARRDVARARAFIAEQGYASDLEGLRAFRRDYLAGGIEAIGDLTHSRDFYLASNLRDLAFHVQEHQLTLPEIAGMLARHGLAFLGFSHLDAATRAAYATETPSDPAQIDLAGWDAFERRRPTTFAAMYQFWSRKL